MIDVFLRQLRRIVSRRRPSIDPDEIFLDSSNLPFYDKYQFEGRLEKPIKKNNILFIQSVFLVILGIFLYQISILQIAKGDFFALKSINNHLKKDTVFAHRGTIVDRNDIPLAWNEFSEENQFSYRKYIMTPGFSNLLGFVKYPKKDSSGNFYSFQLTGQDGIEKYYDNSLKGVNGVKLTEVDVKGVVESQSTIEPPIGGLKLTLSIDSKVQEAMYSYLKLAVDSYGFVGGAGVLMNIENGEVIAMTTYPEYSSSVMTDGEDQSKLKSYFSDPSNPFLDRAVSGLYAPGSVVKPFIAVAAINENIIDPLTNILSTGSISIPNKYDASKPTIFRDWKAHGYVDMRRAIAVSSDVYFYAVGGGYKKQKGLGIVKIDDYLKKFMFTYPTESFFAGPSGTIPSPEWKAKNFKGDFWRVGDTYHTTIGQFGFLTTPLQVTRAMTGIATEGKIVSPSIIKGELGKIEQIEGVSKASFIPAVEGMRQAVTDGTVKALNFSDLIIAAKTGTAELGFAKKYVNSWVTGYYPYKNPKYAFTMTLEKGPIATQSGSLVAMANLIKWMKVNTPEYTSME